MWWNKFFVKFVTVLTPTRNVFTSKTSWDESFSSGYCVIGESLVWITTSMQVNLLRRNPGHHQTTLSSLFGSSNGVLALMLLVGCEFHNGVVLENHRLCYEYTKHHHLQRFGWLLTNLECNPFSIWLIWMCLCSLDCILVVICSMSSTQILEETNCGRMAIKFLLVEINLFFPSFYSYEQKFCRNKACFTHSQ
jgi:hypothetical protein